MLHVIIDYLDQLSANNTLSKSTLESYYRDLKHLSEFLDSEAIDQINQVTYVILNKYISMMKEEGKAVATISRNIAAIRGLFSYLELNHGIHNNPAKKIKIPKASQESPEFLTIEEVNMFLELPDASPKGIRDRAMFELLYATGIRVSELMNLQFKDINLSLAYITCHDSKNMRVIPLNKTACKAIKNYIDTVRNTIVNERERDGLELPLFFNLNGDKMTRQGFWKIVKTYGTQCNLNKTITPHTLRHSFACHLLQNGADIRSIQEMMGHKSIVSTQVYTRLTEQRMKDVYNKSHPRT